MLRDPSRRSVRLAGAALVLIAGLAFARPWLDAVPFEAFMLAEGTLLLVAAVLGFGRLTPFGRVAASVLGVAALLAFATYGNLAWWHLPLLWDIFPLVAVALVLGVGLTLLARPRTANA